MVCNVTGVKVCVCNVTGVKVCLWGWEWDCPYRACAGSYLCICSVNQMSHYC